MYYFHWLLWGDYFIFDKFQKTIFKITLRFGRNKKNSYKEPFSHVDWAFHEIQTVIDRKNKNKIFRDFFSRPCWSDGELWIFQVFEKMQKSKNYRGTRTHDHSRHLLSPSPLGHQTCCHRLFICILHTKQCLVFSNTKMVERQFISSCVKSFL